MWKHPRFDSQECKNLYIKKNIVIVAPRYDIKLQQIYIQTSLFFFHAEFLFVLITSTVALTQTVVQKFSFKLGLNLNTVADKCFSGTVAPCF